MRTLLLLICLALNVSSVFADRPNVIVILTDDQGYADMSCHGNPWLKTPNLDRMAAESVRLEDYHVDPYCTPTRAALMTGRCSTRVGAWSVTQGRQLLKADEVTMADVFAASGYRTGMFGKWHLGDTWPYAPRYRGFQNVVRHLAGGIDEIGNPVGNDYFDDTYYRNGKQDKIDGYCTDVFFDECERMIEQPSDKPFFIFLPLNAMHSPHEVAEKYSAPFIADGHAEKRSKFFGQIINFDENLGRLFDSLETQGIADNTIVIFMGDNGTAEGSNGQIPDNGFNAGMLGKKGSVYEGGHRVACFARWPARLQAGRKIQKLTTCRDWLPTLIDWCDLKTPAGVRFDGRSLKALIENGSEAWPDRTLFVQRQPDQPKPNKFKEPGIQPHFAVLTETWRLVDGKLFNILADPSQQHDVAAEHRDVVGDLKSRYKAHYADVFSDDAAYTRFQLGAQEENPTLLTVRDWHPTDGHVIWKQSQLGDDAIAINGFWAVNVVKAGRYSIRLTRFPDDAQAPMRAKQATLKIGDQRFTKTVEAGAPSVTFEADLPAGHALLQSWIVDAETNVQRGAYFAQVTHVSDQLQGAVDQQTKAQQPTASARQWDLIDIPFQVKQVPHQPIDVAFSATFTNDEGAERVAAGFFNGGHEYVIRFTPPTPGRWSYLTKSTMKGLDQQRGEIFVKECREGRRGGIVLDAKHKRKFRYENGDAYYPIAFECDWLFALDAENANGIPETRKLVDTIAENGFNQVVLNVFAYDVKWAKDAKLEKQFDFGSPRVFPFGGTNDAPDYSTLNIDYFKRLDRVIDYLDKKGIAAHLMIYVWNKRVNWPAANSAADNRYFDYVVRRYQAYPNLVWDISKEALGYGHNDIDYISGRIDRLRKLDSSQRLVTVHDYSYCRRFPNKLDFISVQLWQSELHSVMRNVCKDIPGKPILNIEHGGYERGPLVVFNGNYTSPEVCLERAYQCVFAGTYPTHYWQGAAWNVIFADIDAMNEKDRPRLEYYRHMRTLVEKYNLQQLTAGDKKSNAGFCLHNNKDLFVYYVPKECDFIGVRLPKDAQGRTMTATWFNPLDGSFSAPVAKKINQWPAFATPEHDGFKILVVKIEPAQSSNPGG
ncbi:UNVERIFIED_CONTAM: hypothetical protein GTU68_049922 [Idotea baltica]|nr:hypothetical protein [Idotea baltica]